MKDKHPYGKNCGFMKKESFAEGRHVCKCGVRDEPNIWYQNYNRKPYLVTLHRGDVAHNYQVMKEKYPNARISIWAYPINPKASVYCAFGLIADGSPIHITEGHIWDLKDHAKEFTIEEFQKLGEEAFADAKSSYILKTNLPEMPK